MPLPAVTWWQWLIGIGEFAAAAWLTDWVIVGRHRGPQREGDHRADHSAEWPLVHLGRKISDVHANGIILKPGMEFRRLWNASCLPADLDRTDVGRRFETTEGWMQWNGDVYVREPNTF